MKKLTAICFILVTYATVCKAQTTRFGFTAGATFTNYKSKVDGESETIDRKAGITFGALADIPVSEKFSFQPAINFTQKSAQEKETFEEETSKLILTVNDIEIPLQLLFKSPSGFFIGAGPAFSYSISGKVKAKFDGESESEDLELGEDEDDDFRAIDYSANFLTGYHFPNGLFVSLNFNQGLRNLFPGGSDDGTFKRNYFGIRLGYLLGK